VELADFLLFIQVFGAFASSAVIGIMIHQINEAITDRISRIKFRKLVSKAKRIEARMTLLEIRASAARINLQVEISDFMVSCAIIASLFPVLVLLSPEKTLVAYNVIVFLVSALLIIIAYLVSRVANAAQRRVQNRLNA
jgi:hypothetical protein